MFILEGLVIVLNTNCYFYFVFALQNYFLIEDKNITGTNVSKSLLRCYNFLSFCVHSTIKLRCNKAACQFMGNQKMKLINPSETGVPTNVGPLLLFFRVGTETYS